MKPVAYISEDGVIFKEFVHDFIMELTPLYAMHELTDREIASVCKEHLAPKNCDIYTFARAILLKASEQ
jgi:hypothetical protein